MNLSDLKKSHLRDMFTIDLYQLLLIESKSSVDSYATYEDLMTECVRRMLLDYAAEKVKNEAVRVSSPKGKQEKE